jgi:regulator of nonsense transcripts 2
MLHNSRASELSELSRSEEFSDNDEENDPIIHSFGPFGENILPRMASFRAGDSPAQTGRSPRSLLPAQPLQPTRSPRQPATIHEDKEVEAPEAKPQYTDERSERVRNHAANQLAFSRLSSTPFSTILNNLPPAYWKSGHEYSTGLSRSDIRNILESTKFIGRVAREGKDAAGKPLESEYYYIPDEDDDVMRRSAVVDDLRKPGLRNCRKQHKVSTSRPLYIH